MGSWPQVAQHLQGQSWDSNPAEAGGRRTGHGLTLTSLRVSGAGGEGLICPRLCPPHGAPHPSTRMQSHDTRPHDYASHCTRGAPSRTRRECTQTRTLVQVNAHNSLSREQTLTLRQQRQADSDTGTPMVPTHQTAPPLPHPLPRAQNHLARTHHSQRAQAAEGNGQASCKRPSRSPRAWPEPGMALADRHPFP